MPTTYTVSINAAGRLIINGTPFQAFKSGLDGSTGITFDETFWKKCFIGDSNKDGCPLAILDGFLQADYIGGDNRYSGELIKSRSSQMTKGLEADNLIFKAEILRLKNYKTANNPELRTRFSTAFPEGVPIYTNKDCGLDPAVFLPSGLCIKSCNIASNVIDPHSSSTLDCSIMLPENGDTLILDESVFRYLQYPCACRLSATTGPRGTFNPMSFTVDGEDLLGNIPFYFAGNATKNDNFSRNSKPDAKKMNQKLCVAKYSGDTLQSLIQKIFEIIAPGTYVVSTCDSIVALRSYALNGSYIEVCDDNAQDKVTQVYVWRPNFANPADLAEIFNAEKNRILHGYTDFIQLVTGIRQETPVNNINNICLPGTNTTYRFTDEFYANVIADLETIRGKINGFIPEGATVANIAQAIRLIRTFQVDDFFKTDGRGGSYYLMSMSTKYMKGKYVDLYNTVAEPVPVWAIGKRTSQTFFESTNYGFRMAGGARTAAAARPTAAAQKPPFSTTNSREILSYFFNENIDFYNTEAHGDKTKDKLPSPTISVCAQNKNKYGHNYEYTYDDGKTKYVKYAKYVDLNRQFLEDFEVIFNLFYKSEFYVTDIEGVQDDKVEKYIFSLFYAIESFQLLEYVQPSIDFYSERGILWLIKSFFVETIDDKINDLKQLQTDESTKRAEYTTAISNLIAKKFKIIDKYNKVNRKYTEDDTKWQEKKQKEEEENEKKVKKQIEERKILQNPVLNLRSGYTHQYVDKNKINQSIYQLTPNLSRFKIVSKEKGSKGSQGRKKPPVSSFARSRSIHSSKYLSRRPVGARGGSKTRKNKK